MPNEPTGTVPHGDEIPADVIRYLRAAIWRAMMEIENDGADAAYETLNYAWEHHS